MVEQLMCHRVELALPSTLQVDYHCVCGGSVNDTPISSSILFSRPPPSACVVIVSMKPWKSHLSVGSMKTEAMGFSATAEPSLQVLVVPGNPGLCSFYTMFMQQLHKLFGGKADVWSVSHAGHDSADLTPGKVWCLNSQIEHKVLLLRQHVLAAGKPPSVIVAHSIGSYIMLQAIKRLEEEAAAAGTAAEYADKIPKVVLLMPFLAADWASSRQRFLRLLSNCAPVLGHLAGAVNRLPDWLQDRLVQLAAPRAEQVARESIKQLMGQNSVRNNFHLAWHEFRDLDCPPDWTLISRLGGRAAVVCAPRDIWFPREHYQQMQQALPDVEEVWHEQLTHAFCLDHWQCAEVAQLVLQWIPRPNTSSTLIADDGTDLSVVLGDDSGGMAAGSKQMLPAEQSVRSCV